MDEVRSTGSLAAPSGSAGSGQETRTDEALMVGFRDGESRAFDVLVVRHRRGLFNFLLRSVQNRSRAEEMLQEVFLRVVRSKERYEQTAKFTTWVYTIARNLCVDESRRAKFRRTVSLDAPRRGADGDDGPGMLESVAADQVATDDAAAAPQLRGRIAKAIDLLPDDQREVFLMRQVSGLSFKEIGEIVGAPENTVKSRMRYALDKLRTELKDFADE
ncbi:MAG TPA: RNA polymerase sigma factor [Nannocystis sp.]|jgi:RNA polymerase sigma-70 factor (ECF subfamily)